jgi:hypothetical protein
MMDAVREPHALQIQRQRAKISRVAVAGIVPDDLLEGALDAQVVAVLLVVSDLAAAERRFAQVIKEFFRTRVELRETRHAVAQDPGVGEALDLETKLCARFRRRLGSSRTRPGGRVGPLIGCGSCGHYDGQHLGHCVIGGRLNEHRGSA